MAVKLVTLTISDVALAGMVKAVTVGAVVSARVTVTAALRLEDTFPAASNVHA